MSNPNGIPVLKKDTMVPIELGTGYIKRLYELSMFLVADKTPEQLEALNTAMQQDAPESELWMKHYITVISLLKGIEETAIAKNLVDYRDPSELGN
jgi:hypothetical protein